MPSGIPQHIPYINSAGQNPSERTNYILPLMICLQPMINTNHSYNTQEGSNTLRTGMIHLTTNT